MGNENIERVQPAQQPVQKPAEKPFEDRVMALTIDEQQNMLDEILGYKKKAIEEHKKLIAKYDSDIKYVRDCMKLKNKRGYFSKVQLAKKAEREKKKS